MLTSRGFVLSLILHGRFLTSNLDYLHKKPKDQIALFCGYQNNDYNKWMELLKQANEVGLEKELEKAQNIIGQKQKKLRAFADRNKVTKYKNFPSDKHMAEEVGKSKAYINYQLLSEYTHISASYSSQRTQKRGDVNLFTIYTGDKKLSYAVAAEAAEWIVGAAVAVGNILDIQELQNIKSLGEDGEEILKNAPSLN
ncbi:MAG TPA: DUF5677 domain-containing protein [Thermodesulfobacteriota bacterium]|nr:DUF5677 domain-containing protein [Thermodesulfobacteriota bacterium]